MSSITINGILWYECLDCGHWTQSLCECREESKSKELVKLMNIFRRKYNYWVFTTPFHGSGESGGKNVST